MSASSILSPVTVPLVGQSNGSSGDAPAFAGDFAAVLAAETSETVSTTASTDPALEGGPPTSGGLVEDAVRAQDQMAASSEAVTVPLWIQLTNATPVEDPSLVRNSTPSEATENAINVGDDFSPNTISGQSVSSDGFQGEVVPTSLPLETFEADTTPEAVQAKALTLAVTTDAAAQRLSAAGEAALASLRAMPGAAALQQATITQRRIDVAAAKIGSRDTPVPETLEASPLATVASKPPGIETPSGEMGLSQTSAPQGKISSAARIELPSAGAGTPITVDAGVADSAASTDSLDLVAEALPSSLDEAATGPVATASASATTSAASASNVTTSLSSLSRATIETTAQLAAQITNRLAGQSTRFELGLTPEGLGRVDVTLDIDSDGQLSARLAFDNPLAATELRGRADDLRRQLEDAGFTLARDALDFSSRDNSSGGGTDRRQQRATAYADRHQAQNDFSDTQPVWALPPSNMMPRGVDVKV